MKNYLPNILITGGNGQVATALHQHKLARELQITACTREEMDICDITSIQHALTNFNPDIIINTAAYTAVDMAEQETETCLRTNHMGAKHLAIACKKQQIPLIHLSTDYIFDGTKNFPYREDDAATPINFYGKSKWLGEQAVREHSEQHIILRVSGVFGEHGNNFLKTMLRLAKEKKELRIVADQITCPTYAGDIAGAIFTLLKQELRWGTYHYCSAPPASWHQFATAIIHAAQHQHSILTEEIKAITTAEYPTAAKRPAYSVMDCSKIKNDYGITQPSWLDAVRGALAK